MSACLRFCIVLFDFGTWFTAGIRRQIDDQSAKCTPRDQDPYQTGSKVDCCSGTEAKLGGWYGGSKWTYLCKQSNDDSECQAQWNDNACSGQDCYTCGARIEYMQKSGKTGRQARDQVAAEFPVECGKCASVLSTPRPTPLPVPVATANATNLVNGGSTCQAQWDNKACTGQFGKEECYTCGARIEWLKGQGNDEKMARQRVAQDFVSQCGQCAPEGGIGNLSDEGYSLVWSDEFDGNSIDEQNWKLVHMGGGFGNNELQFYTNRKENAWVSDGTLKIKAIREDFEGLKYTSAKLETVKDWMYGKFHVRARLNLGTARGTWGAHWMLPRVNKYGIWPKSGEIDIFEHVGYDTGTVHGTVHTQAYHHSIGTQRGGSIGVNVKEWHNYTVEWRPDIILFAMDNRVYQIFKKESDTDKDKWPFDMNFFVILNMAVGGNWGGQKGIDENAFLGDGQIMEVDWVRVEQRGVGSSVPAVLPTPTPPTPLPTQAEPELPTPGPSPVQTSKPTSTSTSASTSTSRATPSSPDACDDTLGFMCKMPLMCRLSFLGKRCERSCGGCPESETAALVDVNASELHFSVTA